MNKYKIAKKVSIITIVWNIVLAIIKILAGVIGKSSAMVADGIHTVSDVLTTAVVLVGIKIASKEPDENHPYGHEKYESVFAKLLSMILLLTGVMIAYEAIKTLVTQDFNIPDKLAVYAAIFSIFTKEVMYRYTIKTARTIESTSMEADAWHHRSDALSSIGTLLGILGARAGFPALDPIAGLIVAALVVKVGVDLYLRSVSHLVDESANKKTLDKIRRKTLEVPGVRGINDLRTRVSGSSVFVDMDIAVDSKISVESGHEIAENVQKHLKKEIRKINHCMIHIEPFKN